MRDFYTDFERADTVKARFEQQKDFRLPSVPGAHTHGKEYHFTLSWNADGQKIVNNKLDCYDGKLYFFDRGYLFQSNEDGSMLKILLKVGEYFKTTVAANIDRSNIFLAVNKSGVYLYQHGKNLLVSRFTLEGEFCKSFAIPGNITQVYIAENHIYYAKVAAMQQVCCFDCATEQEVAIMGATKVLELYGDDNRVVFRVAFEKTMREKVFYDEGWYLYEVSGKWLHCLTSRNCPPHYLHTQSNCYLEGDSKYIDFKEQRKIRAVDLIHNIMWVATPLKERLENSVTSYEYWEPFSLAADGEPLLDAPIWRMTDQQFGAGPAGNQLLTSSYFDGTTFLCGRPIYFMKSFRVDGTVEHYAINTSKGACHNFRVLNGFVYADFEGQGWEQHKIEESKLTFVRACQFGENAALTPEVRKLISNVAKR